MSPHEKALAFADYLERPEILRTWDFSSIVHGSVSDYLREHDQDQELIHFCGTVGCALSHLAVWGQGRKDGWHFSLDLYSEEATLFTPTDLSARTLAGAASEYFGIEPLASREIFYNSGHLYWTEGSLKSITPRMVAEALREAVAEAKCEAPRSDLIFDRGQPT